MSEVASSGSTDVKYPDPLHSEVHIYCTGAETITLAKATVESTQALSELVNEDADALLLPNISYLNIFWIPTPTPHVVIARKLLHRRLVSIVKIALLID
jgi:hypothetical protein